MVSYEWDVETTDPTTGDVTDHQFGEKLKELPWPSTNVEKLVLVRTAENGDRLWAYVDESRMLPRHFSRPEADGNYYETNVTVPQRFHREIARVACGRYK